MPHRARRTSHPAPRTPHLALIALACVFAVTVLSAQMSPRRTQWAEGTPVVESEAVHAGSTARLALEVKIAEGFHVQANHPRDEALISMELTLDPPAGVTFTDIAYPPSTVFSVAGTPSDVFEGTILIGVRVAIASDRAPGLLTIPGRLRYQACDDRLCYSPASFATSWDLRVVPTTQAISLQRQDIFSKIDFSRAETPDVASLWRPASAAPAADGAASARQPTEATPAEILALFDQFEPISRYHLTGKPAGAYMKPDEFVKFVQDAESGAEAQGPFEGRGVAAILAIVFLGGLALNLTPCVLPMIPINLAIIGAGAQSKKRSRGFALGAAYGAAMTLVYGALGLIVVMVGGTFGTINSTVWFNVGIALLFVVLGLAMFDVISIDFSKWSSRFRFDSASRGSFLLAFGMGALAALLAGACVAPVVIQVVVFSSNLYASGTSLALALPFVLGLGMALPWPLAGAGISSLPKPGAWMVRVKQAMGVFILASAAYYGYLAYQIIDSRRAQAAGASAGVFQDGWYTSVVEGLQAAKRDNTPVLVDFWATWCKDCIVMDRTTLKDPTVLEALKGHTLVKYQTEEIWLPHIEQLLERYGSPGLPAYVILRPKKQ